MTSRVELDHVAVAVERHTDAFGRYVAELGARWVSSGPGVGFSPTQLAFRAGILLELLEPDRVGENDFLRRFLDRDGPGPHHLTFKVADIASVLATADARGYPALNLNLGNPLWQDAFLHPKQAAGIVIQVAQSVPDPHYAPRPPAGLPRPAAGTPATLVHVAHAVPRLGDGLALFSGLLAGAESGRGADAGSVWVDLSWPGGGRIRLVAPDGPSSPLVGWLGGRPGRLHHLGLDFEPAGTVAGARPRRDGTWEVPPEANLGVRLLIRPPGAGPGFSVVDQG